MKKKALFSSILTIALCVSLIAGSTFALFTSESTVNIAITSATVEMVASIDNIETWSLEDDKAADGRTDGTFTQGGTAKFDADAKSFSIDKIVPGDKVAFEIVGTNNSTVKVMYRYIIQLLDDNGLVYGLVANVDGADYEALYTYRSQWMTLDAKTDMDPVKVSFELPVEANNDYQNKTLNYSVTVEAVQGNATAEHMAEVAEEKEVVTLGWTGEADTSWYNENETTFTLSTSEAVAGLTELVDGGNSFEGKTIKLDDDINLFGVDENGEPICFEPIGSYRNDTPFKGTFDGQGHTIANLSQNTWALNNGYYYGDLGLGLFGKVEDAHIKNLTVDSASVSGESALCGGVAATAYGECTFENITVSNSDVADYQYYAGGIVGWASGNHKYIGCTVDESTKIAGQWGDFNNANGGLIGGAGANGTYYFEDCTVACVIDSYNDVTSAYEWWAYRRSGMLIGDTNHTTTDANGTVIAAAPNVTCVNVKVIYNEWANYHYCYFGAMGYPWVRVEAGVSNSAYSNPRYGHPTDANGNVVVDANHVHNEGEAHNELIVFDQLFGGPNTNGGRNCVYGNPVHPGVEVIYNNK